MKGLLTKDFILFKSIYGKNILFVCAIYFALTFMMGTPTFLFMMLWVIGFYVVNLFTVDNASKWDAYANCLPVSRAKIISSKYIVLIIMVLASSVIAIGGLGILGLFGKIAFLEQLAATAVILVLSLGLFGVTLCLSVKYGPEKARILNTVAFLALFALISLGAYAAKNNTSPTVTAWLANNSERLLPLAISVGAVVFLLMFGISWLLSIRIYSRKEF